MDGEDLADAEEAKKIQTNEAFAGLGATDQDTFRATGLMGLLRVEGDTMGTKLLKKMGWKEGQGIGPKVRRAAQLDMKSEPLHSGDAHLFAPKIVQLVLFERKMDQKGLGFLGQPRLTRTSKAPPARPGSSALSEDEDDEESLGGRPRISMGVMARGKGGRGGLGVGVLNDTGSDDEDPYEIGPRISYNRSIITGKSKKEKKQSTVVNPAVKSKPMFNPSKKLSMASVGLGLRKCHDGRLPLDGFVLAQGNDASLSSTAPLGKYPPPQIPPDWKSSKRKVDDKNNGYVSTAAAAKASSLDPISRAALLGEQQLPGKSVFDFMSESARARLAAATGQLHLPPAKNEIPAGFIKTEDERRREMLDAVPKLDQETAKAAMTRATFGGSPYGDDEEKRARYMAYLKSQTGLESLAAKPAKMKSESWIRELHEFYNCARIFKPMTGTMASRFTTSKSSSTLASASGTDVDETSLLSRPVPKAQDAAEEAAKLGLYGPMTRSVADFYPVRLLCKRFNVKPPAHVQPDQDSSKGGSRQDEPAGYGAFHGVVVDSQTLSAAGREKEVTENFASGPDSRGGLASKEAVIDSARNEAIEGKRAGQALFKAVFGDSDDDNDN